jgi:hypothetical protein
VYVAGQHHEREIVGDDALASTLHFRDARGGADLWVSDAPGSFPCLAIRLSGPLATIHFFPKEGHPGFRCTAPGSPENGATRFVFEGCDPASGESVPTKFVLSVNDAERVLRHFHHSRQMLDRFDWFEL